MRLGRQIRLIVCCLLLSSSLFAAKITGKVTNGTTGKPSSGDEVVLLSLASGMDEIGRTKTDAKGEFSFDVRDEGVPHLVQVSRQGANYFQPAPPGKTTVAVTVYDAAKKVDNLTTEGRVIRLQAADKELQVSDLYILRNESQPPRTWVNDRTFEITLPDGAKVEDGIAVGPGGMPISSSPVSTGKSNRYAFAYAIRPGRSQLQVTYKMPYGGAQDFVISPDISLGELGVMLPKSMRFSSSGNSFVQTQDEQGMTTYVAKSLAPGQKVTFSISGEGMAPREAQSEGAEGGQAGAPSDRPGGGLGAPIGAPDPLTAVKWPLLGGLIVVMAGLGIWMVRRKPSPQEGSAGPASKIASAGSGTYRPSRPVKDPRAQQQGAPQSSLLDALKDELFQLEADRLQGKISQQDYATAKAGLDMLVRRHIKQAGESQTT
ncbi:MAG TPA: carboxypeptidase-like regulatory domain-containing protein [Candidatus Angelobacter sp.]|nr:carboxypeptidase-like regulatory domain-containing protein [Candidatus Angelobacter sp.]